jgi:hypothetical protein
MDFDEQIRMRGVPLALIGRYVALLDIPVEELRQAPNRRMSSDSREIDHDETIRIAITRR